MQMNTTSNKFICKCNKCKLKNVENACLKTKSEFWKHIDNKNIIQAEHSLRTIIEYNKTINTLKKLENQNHE